MLTINPDSLRLGAEIQDKNTSDMKPPVYEKPTCDKKPTLQLSGSDRWKIQEIHLGKQTDKDILPAK